MKVSKEYMNPVEPPPAKLVIELSPEEAWAIKCLLDVAIPKHYWSSHTSDTGIALRKEISNYIDNPTHFWNPTWKSF